MVKAISPNIKALGVTVSLSCSFLFWFIPSGSLFQKFMPRSVCMFREPNLITMHAIADSAIFVAYLVIALCLFQVYKIVEEKELPFKGFLWMFGIFILFCGFTHGMGVLNLWVTYYWIDGAVKAVCAIFSGLTAVYSISVPKVLRDLYTGDEYRSLQRKYDQLEERLKAIEKHQN